MSNYKTVFFTLGVLQVILGLAMIIPVIIQFIYGELDSSFISSGIITIVFGILFFLSNLDHDKKLNLPQAFLLTALSWLSIAVFGSLPFIFSKLNLNITDAFFESMSGITTTGSTVIVNLDIVPNSTLKRNSFGLNSSQKLGDKITVDVNMKYILEDQVGNPQLSDSPGNGNFAVNLFAPTVNVNDMLGAGGLGRNADLTEFRISDNSYSQNPWFAAYNYINSSEKERFIGAINARWDIKDYLYVRGRVGGDRYDHHRTNSTPWGTAYQPNGSMNETKRAFQQYDADVFIGTDNLKLDDDVSFTAFVGVGQNSQKYSATGVSGSHFIVPG